MRIVIIGAGVTGLSSAWFLRRAGHDVTVFEAASRAGGTVHTVQRDGFVLEQGPSSLRAGSPVLWGLLEGLDLTEHVLPASPAAKRRYLVHGGELCALPSGPLDALTSPLVGPLAMARAMGEPLVGRSAPDDETVHAFLARRLGPRIANRFAEPLMAGIFAGDPHQLELASVFPKWATWQAEYGGLIAGGLRAPRPASAGPKGPFAFRGGMQRLVDALVGALGDALQLATPVRSVQRRDDAWEVHTETGVTRADQVVVTCPADDAAGFLPPERAPAFRDRPRAPIAAVHLAYRLDDLPRALDGFGWLSTRAEHPFALGGIWVSAVFPDHTREGHALLRLMLGGTRCPQLVAEDDDALVRHARDALATLQHVHAEPVLADVSRHRRGIPQYVQGHGRWVDEQAALTPGLHLAGWGYRGIGLVDSLETGARLVEALR